MAVRMQSSFLSTLLLLCLIFHKSCGKDVSFALNSDHASYRWRSEVGKPKPSLKKTLVWMLHEQVGIGNAFGGFSEALLQAMIEDRELIIQSRIIEKFCKVVECSIHQVDDSFKSSENDIKRVSHFHIDVNRKPDPELLPILRKFHPYVGCIDLPKGYEESDRDVWSRMCFFSKMVQSLVIGGNGLLHEKRKWLFSHYSGDSSRFDKVLTLANRKETTPKQHHVFDAAIHIRTIALIEDMSQKDGRPANVENRTDAFANSIEFETMIKCFAQNIVEDVKVRMQSEGETKGGTTSLAENHLDQMKEDMNTKHHSSSSGNKKAHLERLEEEIMDKRKKYQKTPSNKKVYIYLATDTPGVRAKFAERISEITKQMMYEEFGEKGDESEEGSKGKNDFQVEVDYFKQSLPPAHFFLWTMNNDVKMTDDNWNRLVGTAAEWLFISEARRTLMVKGLNGGQKALISSFSSSAAAFGSTEELTYLSKSNPEGFVKKGVKACHWQDIASYS